MEGLLAYIILPSSDFQGTSGVSGSIGPKPVLIKGLGLARSRGQKASPLVERMKHLSLKHYGECRLYYLKFLLLTLTVH